MSNIQLIHWECIEEMNKLIDQWVKVDAIITDPPYWITKCKRDNSIPFEDMRKCVNLLSNDRTPCLLFGNEPFASKMRISNIKNYKYDFIRDKGKWSNPLLAKKQFMRSHENVCVFYKKQPTYNPQMEVWKPYKIPRTWWNRTNRITSPVGNDSFIQKTDPSKRYPKSIKKFSIHCWSKYHPTQKPVALMEYLIKTYTNESETVLDFTMGSWTTWVACKNLNRNFIGIEQDDKYFEMAKNRINWC